MEFSFAAGLDAGFAKPSASVVAVGTAWLMSRDDTLVAPRCTKLCPKEAGVAVKMPVIKSGTVAMELVSCRGTAVVGDAAVEEMAKKSSRATTVRGACSLIEYGSRLSGQMVVVTAASRGDESTILSGAMVVMHARIEGSSSRK